MHGIAEIFQCHGLEIFCLCIGLAAFYIEDFSNLLVKNEFYLISCAWYCGNPMSRVGDFLPMFWFECLRSHRILREKFVHTVEFRRKTLPFSFKRNAAIRAGKKAPFELQIPMGKYPKPQRGFFLKGWGTAWEALWVLLASFSFFAHKNSVVHCVWKNNIAQIHL